MNYRVVNDRRYYKLLDIETKLYYTGIRYALSKTDFLISMKSDKNKRNVFYVSEDGIDYLVQYLREHKRGQDANILERIKRVAVPTEEPNPDTGTVSETETVETAEETPIEEEEVSIPKGSPLFALEDLYKTFLYGNSPVRMILRGDDIWFVASDICAILEIKNSRDAIERLESDEKDVALTDTPGGIQKTTIINEPGLYTLVLSSRKREAKNFKRWVTHDVIPTIRNAGGYMHNPEQMLDHYFSHLDDATKTVVREAFQTIDTMQRENTALKAANRAMARDIQTWDSRAVVTSLVRKLSSARYGGNFQLGWGKFYKELRYKSNIGLAQREPLGVPLMDKVLNDEWPTLISVAAAMCEDVGIDVAETINEINSERVTV